MAVSLKGITKNQSSALIAAFGYERYPSGNEGHTRNAKNWLDSRGLLLEYTPGSADVVARGRVKSHWSKADIRTLKALADARNGRQRWPAAWK